MVLPCCVVANPEAHGQTETLIRLLIPDANVSFFLGLGRFPSGLLNGQHLQIAEVANYTTTLSAIQ